jgi:MHS family shikimate/dehydroshikimate transporter-like MFS transporter
MSVGGFSLVSTLPTEMLLSGGWRVPFLQSVAVVAVGLYLRLQTPETPDFSEDVARDHGAASVPLLALLRTSPKRVLIAMGANLGLVGFSYVVQTFVLAYASGFLGLPSTVGLVGVLLGAAIGAVTMPMFGAVADRIGPRPVIMSGAAFSAVFAFPFFWLLDTKVMVLVWLAIIVGLGVCVASMFGPIAAFYTGLFPTRYRYSGLVFAWETTGAVIGGRPP